MDRYKVACTGCGRVFDMTNAADASEWAYGHDCEDDGVLGEEYEMGR